MISTQFDYLCPGTVEEAVKSLRKRNAVALAGGIGLFNALETGRVEPGVVVDLTKVAGLAGVTVDSGRGVVTVGALTTYASLLDSAEVAANCPLLAEVAALCTDPMVRNRITVGGSLADNDPAADLPAVALALEATVTVVGKEGTRRVAAAELLTGAHRTALRKAELITQIEFSVRKAGTGCAYEKFASPANGSAICGVAAVVEMGGGGTIASARVALTGATSSATRLGAVESGLAGKAPSAEAIGAAWQAGRKGLRFRSDLAASAEYRAHLAGVLLKRALGAAAGRARS